MKRSASSVPRQLVLFEIDARGQPLALQPRPPLPPPDRGQPAPARSSIAAQTRVNEGSRVAAAGLAGNDLAGLLAECLSKLAGTAVGQRPSPPELRQARHDWL